MIGIFDSGIGGLTVVRELLKLAPDAAFVYFGDSARAPYGNKSAETIVRYAQENAAFLLAQGATSLVIACNTASALAADALRNIYPSIPIFDVVTPAVEEALRETRGHIGIIGTRATIGSGVYEKKIRKLSFKVCRDKLKICSIACPLFVPLVEEGWLERAETKRIVRLYLSPLRRAQIDTLVLGCTHYPLLTPLIRRYVGNRVRIVDSGRAVVARLSSHIVAGSQEYLFTDVSPHTQTTASNWLNRPIKVRHFVAD